MILPQRLVLEKESTRTKSTREKGKEIPSKKKHRRSKARAREIPRVIPREEEESPHNQVKRMEKVQKTWNPPAGPGEKNTRKGGKKNTGKSCSKGKNNDGKEWRQSKERSKVTFSDVECFFMKLMKGANVEDWIFFGHF